MSTLRDGFIEPVIAYSKTLKLITPAETEKVSVHNDCNDHFWTPDGDLREALLHREIEDHNHQHERFHDPSRQAADCLYVQCWFPESTGRNVSAVFIVSIP